MLCSVVKHQEAATARKERTGKHEQIGSNNRQEGISLTENSNRIKKKPQYSVCQKKKEKQRIWIIKFYSWTIPKKKWETCHFCGWWRELSFVPCYLLLQRILFKLMRASVIQKLYYKLCFRFCLIFWIFDCSVLRRKRTCKSLNVFYNQFTSSWYDWAKNKINPS